MDKNPGAGNRSRTGDLNLGKVALYQLSYSRILVFAGSGKDGIPQLTDWMSIQEESGAGNRSRTGDLNLGKVALYQLSYSRASDLYKIKQDKNYKPAFVFLQTAIWLVLLSRTFSCALLL